MKLEFCKKHIGSKCVSLSCYCMRHHDGRAATNEEIWREISELRVELARFKAAMKAGEKELPEVPESSEPVSIMGMPGMRQHVKGNWCERAFVVQLRNQAIALLAAAKSKLSEIEEAARIPEFTSNPLKPISINGIHGLAKTDEDDIAAYFYKKVEVKRHINRLAEHALHLAAFKHTVIDRLITRHIYSQAHDTDPHAAVTALVNYEVARVVADVVSKYK